MSKHRDDHSPDWAHFQGYQSPNYTQVPDQLFDEHLAYLSGAELKVLLYVVRRTFGFKRDSDNISLSQMLRGITTKDGRYLDHGVGLSKPTLLTALRSLQEKNLLTTERRRSVERGDEPTVYRLRITGQDRGQNTIHPVVKKFDQGGGKEISPGPWSKNLTTQETVLQETVRQDTDPSNVRKANTRKKKRQGERIDPAAGESTPGIETPMSEPREGAGPSGTGSLLDGMGESHPPLQEAHGAPPSSARTKLPERGSQDKEGEAATIAYQPPLRVAPESRRGGFAAIGDLLHQNTQKQGSVGRLARQRAYPEDRQQVLAFIQDFAIEFGDEAPLPSSVSRAYNLYQSSGIPIAAFVSFLYEARAMTKEHSASVKKVRRGKAGPFGPDKNKMPYFFEVLERLVTQHTPGTQGSASPAATQGADRPEAGGEDSDGRGGRANPSRSAPSTSTMPRRPARRRAQLPQSIVSFVADVAEEYGGRGNTAGYLSEVWDLYEDSRLPEDAFLQVLEIGRTISRAHQDAPEGQMAYLFAIVRQQLGLTDEQGHLDPAQ
ncbi:MAG: replication protein [Chloroflexi bacterium]|nr:replication protein [Chloroflexota bacterium]